MDPMVETEGKLEKKVFARLFAKIELKGIEVEYDGPPLQFAPDMLKLIFSMLPSAYWRNVMGVCKLWNEMGKQVFDPNLPSRRTGVIPIVKCSKSGNLDAIKSIVNLPKYKFESITISSCMIESLRNKHMFVFKFFLSRGGFDDSLRIAQIMSHASREMKGTILESDKINWSLYVYDSTAILRTVRTDYDLILALEERGIKCPNNPDDSIINGHYATLRRIVELYSHRWSSSTWRKNLKLASRSPSLEIFHFLRMRAGSWQTFLFVLSGR
eukprot:TRINITY_DN8382_c0_g1_i2.p1 TRINITY_DN8382_c0_g1~~TRINITY_DN8382_c0_g1_i2.p1  ORF type:complete len:296 (-),score=54.25 TRINITY_DN8382_c0_g1_i2:103-912(-)